MRRVQLVEMGFTVDLMYSGNKNVTQAIVYDRICLSNHFSFMNW